jgi:hypothetical protein
MNGRSTSRLVVICTLLLLAGNLSAQPIQNAGSAGAQFLKIGVGARAMGMGGAYASMSDDPAALAWNPAGIGTIYALRISAEHTSWVAGIDHNFVGLVVPVTDQFNLGLHTIFVSSGDIEITTIDNPEGTGQFYDASDIAVGLTSSIRLTTQLTFATTLKYIEERLYDVSSSGVAIDAGMWYATEFNGLNLGFVVSNLGFDQEFSGRSLEVQYDPPEPGEPLADSELQTLPFSLPLTFRASGSIDLFRMSDEPSGDHSLITALDFIQHTDTEERLALGMEYTWRGLLSLRSGYLFNADELSWSVGGGLKVDVSDFHIGFDYAGSSLGRFGLGHRIGLSIGY